MKRSKLMLSRTRLSEVTLSLRKMESMPGLSVTEVTGIGRRGDSEIHRHPDNDPWNFMSNLYPLDRI